MAVNPADAVSDVEHSIGYPKDPPDIYSSHVHLAATKGQMLET